ncbi:polyketide synthase [Streptomyces alfalfae]|uniref:Polyketide synthase n=1 Tax=Streptomyces alfalfae TaxID=1642299 RepID=A0A7T4TYS4_9ACTN|nr:polyketide synthase [Streptomyces alfalfae]QQC89687.1 polyketide synthase [Streptomyces alfalfae]
MHSEDTTCDQWENIGKERTAIVGIAALTPRVMGVDAYWEYVRDASGGPRSPARWAPDEPAVDVARFGIPPVQARSMARLQPLMLEAAEQCLRDAGAVSGGADDRTDVVVGTCFGLDRQYANALRIAGSAYAREVERAALATGLPEAVENAGQAAEELRGLLQRTLGASPHDRVGEMASTIPARIASAFGLRGRTLAVESADATAFVALAQALGSLRAGLAERALVLTGQLHESEVLTSLLRAKGLLPPPGPADRGELAEGVGAVLLKPLAAAERDGDRIYATIADCRVRHHGTPGRFRHETSVERHRDLLRAAHRAVGAQPGGVRYVERTGTAGEAESAELAALAAESADAEPPVIGVARDRTGHTFAHAGIAALTTAALALHHRTLPAHRTAAGTAPAAPWAAPADGTPRRAAVSGTSLTGTLGHLVLEEHRPTAAPAPAPAPAAVPRAARLPEPVAVVAYGGRFADAEDADAYWRLMLSGEDRLRPVPADRLDRELHHAPGVLNLNRSYTDLGGWADVPQSPPPGADIPPERYAALDAAQRLALAVADEVLGRYGGRPLTGRGMLAVAGNLGLANDRRAHVDRSLGELEDAVRDLTALKGLSTAEVEGLIDTARQAYGPPAEPTADTLDGALASGTAALIAGAYGLDAVPFAVEAACASSLAALDTALTALRSGAVDYALAGGVELPCSARDMVLCSALGLLSHSRITPFDAGADGFTPGDGCALFLLKRRSDAVRDGDEIVALLTGSGASNDAKSLIAPDVDGQVRAMRQAFTQVAHGPADVDYLEAHGTGTKVGDRVEITATGRVYGGAARPRPLEIGSAKGFVGHTFAAAGGAGLLRALLALRARTLPPHTHLDRLNPALGLDDLPAAIGTRPRPWPAAPGAPRRAAVSSFGTGGINYHLLVEEDYPR